MTRLPAVAVALAALWAAEGCTKTQSQPCSTDRDCARFGGAVCDQSTLTCWVPDAGVALGDGMSSEDGGNPPSCTTSSQCGDPSKPICEMGTSMCRACEGPGDNSACLVRDVRTPRCDQTGVCAGCRKDMEGVDCPSATPICDSDGSCRKCASHSDCPSLVCNLDGDLAGTCADQTQVAYVDNKNGTCSGAHSGTQDDPYCEIQTAVMNLGARTFIRVLASSVAYAHLSISSGSFSIVGPGGFAAATAKVAEVTANPTISVTGATTSVIIDGLEVAGGGVGQDGIYCANASLGPTMTVRRTYVHGAAGAGISASRCTVSIDRSKVGPANTGGGLSFTGSQFDITNSMIVGNISSMSPGIYFGPGCAPITGGGFRHNTISGNSLGVNQAGGISCNAGAPIAIENSIVWSNGKSAAGTQLSGECSLSYSDIDDSTTPSGVGNRSTAPDFEDAMNNDLHLAGRTPNNNACCIDQIISSPVGHDFDGSPRPAPAGGKFDIGAHEVQ